MIYPQFYLDGNISLQETIERYHKNTARWSLQWLFASVACFVALLIGITFEIHVLSIFAILELLVSGWTIYEMSNIPKEFQ